MPVVTAQTRLPPTAGWLTSPCLRQIRTSAMRILGINALYHDPSAALVVDGKTVAAAEEERFSRRKHGKRPVPFSAWELPELAAGWCLDHAGLAADELDAVTYSFDPVAAPAADRPRCLRPVGRAAAGLCRDRAGLPGHRAAGPGPVAGAVRSAPCGPCRLGGAGRAVRRQLRRAGAGRPRRAAQPAGRPLRRRGDPAAVQPAAAALARPAVRGRHRASGFPAQLR